RAARAVRGVLEPGDLEQLTAEPSYHGQAVAAVAADSYAAALAALDAGSPEWEVLDPLVDPEEAVRRGSLIQEPRRYERGDLARGLAEADAVVEAEDRTQTVLHNPLETHQAVCTWEGDTLVVYVSTQYVWGVRDEVAKAFDLQ